LFAQSGLSECANCVSLYMSGLPSRAATNQVAQLKHNGIGNAVEDTIAGSLAAYKPGVEENLKVFRYVRLISLQRLDDLADGHCFTLKCLQDAEAARLS
jgi:hypothetical protein